MATHLARFRFLHNFFTITAVESGGRRGYGVVIRAAHEIITSAKRITAGHSAPAPVPPRFRGGYTGARRLYDLFRNNSYSRGLHYRREVQDNATTP
jgi:hypothetical protein